MGTQSYAFDTGQLKIFLPDQLPVIPSLFLLEIIIPINKHSEKAYNLA